MSLAAASLSAGWTYRNGFETLEISTTGNWYVYGIFTFFATLSVYNFQRLYKLKTLVPRSNWLIWVAGHSLYLKLLVVFSTISAITVLFILIGRPLDVLFLFTLIGGICLFYVVPILGKSLRDLAGLKTPLIAFVWTGIIILFPIVNEKNIREINVPEVITFFSYVFALTIPFDIRDLKYDSPSLQTVPQLIGIKGTKILAILLLLLVFIISTYYTYLDLSIVFGYAILLSIFLILGANQRRRELYFALLDVSMIFVGVAYFL